ncbi:MAG: glucoamylase family protein [Eubacteriales bacterium]|nr:glucoamylase family protein [Eubacteriales bacterium]MDD4629747.1 glucoamylase family protein [Eubacteriales bacterium]
MSFPFSKQKNKNFQIFDVPLPGEILEDHARITSLKHTVSSKIHFKNRPLTRMNDNYNFIQTVCKSLNDDALQKQAVPPAAEWLLDNFYIVEEQVKGISRDFSKNFYYSMPVLNSGALKGHIRVFAIAMELVSHTDGQIEINTLLKYLEAYQSNNILLEKEIRVIPDMIKLALIENIRMISEKINETKAQWDMADKIFEEWYTHEDTNPEQIIKLIKSNGADVVNSSFIEHLFYRFRRSGRSYTNVLQCIDENLKKFHTSTEIIAEKEHNIQAVYTVTIGNCIACLKYISSFDWSELFEQISNLDKILKQDPDGTYCLMDVSSRNHYKSRIGVLAEAYRVSELHIAREAISLAGEAAREGSKEKGEESDSDRNSHVGYYLTGAGLRILEKRLNLKKKPAKRLADVLMNNLGSMYLCFIIAFTMITVLFISWYSAGFPDENRILLAILTGAAVFIPASEISVLIANRLACRIKSPAFFPRLELKEGIPESMSTMVVMPALLTDGKRVEQLLENMESHYLANKEENLYFALIGAFADSNGPNANDDTKIIQLVSRGIKDLNNKYAEEGNDIFYFYNRLRKYNASDNNWTGWERKRGALMEFNEMLLGSQETSFFFYSNAKLPTNDVKYIITLDADTLLPFGMAKKMISTMAHPLNIPVIDKERKIVTQGYGVMQPRVTFDIESSNRSIFSRIHTGQEGIDPYASAISDVYQDLFGEGIFTGKGIYELRTFQGVLKDAVPENAILSHDLLEGSYVRAALVNDMELVDSYPSSYKSYMARLHRWTRGDWQLIPWLGRKIHNRNGELIKNPLSYISRWKIADNLRRSLISPSVLLLILLGFSILPGSSILWIGFGMIVLGLPFAISLIDKLFCKGFKFNRIKRHSPCFSGLKSLFWQFMLAVILLPYQAVTVLHAVIITLIRVFITRKNMLEWVTSADVEKIQVGSLRGYVYDTGASFIFTSFLVAVTFLIKTDAPILRLFFLAVWGTAPYIAYRISQKDDREEKVLKEEEQDELGRIARKTWRYFEEFSNSKNNYLIPDNFQEDPPRGIAYRTSPTNIALGLLAFLSARDMGYIGIKETIDSISKTVATIEKMEKWNGHLYNWYDTRTLQPLKPLYVSTVDSGNYVCYLITLTEGIKKYYSSPLIDPVFVKGIKDTIRNEIGNDEVFPPEFTYFDFIEKGEKIDLILWNRALDEFISGTVIDKIKKPVWKAKTVQMVRMLKAELDEFAPWVSMADKAPKELFNCSLAEETDKLIEILKTNVSLQDIPDINKSIIKQIDKLLKSSVKIKDQSFQNGYAWMNELIAAVLKASETVSVFQRKYNELTERIQFLYTNTSFVPLYNESRQLFSIGYNIEEKKLTNSYYDLLASEARQTSFIAIAKGDVPYKHWFMLGRALTVIDHYKGLVSWSGTMFEYLMPLLIMKCYRNTLLDETYSFAVKSHQKYGKIRGMPWGSSESCYGTLDTNLDYQYKAIGVPWLGLKRGLIEDAVAAPYAAFMALMVNPREAYKNIMHLKAEGLEGAYGFYEAADYTPERTGLHSQKIIIKSFMAHHQGMSLLSINNYLNDNIMQTRFSADPHVEAAKLLLQEKVPTNILFTKDAKEKPAAPKANIYREKGACRRFTMPDSGLPRAHILSNGNYSVMLTDRGTGYSRTKSADISRWREDLVDDRYGMFFYVKDVSRNCVWSAAYAPANVPPDKYEVVFTPDKAVYKRSDGEIDTSMEVVAATNDSAEIRLIKLKNNGTGDCILEAISYFEVVLASSNSDLAHPAFSNLFVRTEFDQERKVLLANRRPRGTEDKEMWIAQIPVIDGEMIGDIQYETDRMQFIGRGRTVNNPVSISSEKPLSNTVGPVLDPIFSLKIKLKIEPDEEARIYFVTVAAQSREAILEMAEKYSSAETCDASFWLALTRSHVEAKFLNIKAHEMELYQEMISDILFISPQRLKYRDIIKANRKGQSSLWPYGISGDRPIILMVIHKTEEAEILYEVLKAHEYWRTKDLRVDLVILIREENSYSNPVYSLIAEIIHSNQTYDACNHHNDIFLINSNTMSDGDLELLYAVARLIFTGDGGTMKEQMMSEYPNNITRSLPENDTKKPKPVNMAEHQHIVKRKQTPLYGKRVADVNELQFFNGSGGFSSDGREYVIRLADEQMTPAPWVNVISNPDFGFMVTEAGGGFSWCENSRENKISTWSNDPVSDGQGEIFYLCDENKELWSITPLPIREKEDYIIRHGFGYTEFHHESHGVLQSLVQFVPVKESVKISIIQLSNKSNEDKTISITYYLKPVLGVNTRETSMHLMSSQSEEGVLMIENRYNREFADRVCFMDTSAEERYITGDRNEFLGSGGTNAPDSLKRNKLSGRSGACYDPCAAMQVHINLKANETSEIVFLLGMARSKEEVRELAAAFRNTEKAKESLMEVKEFWQEKLQTIQVNTPDPSMNIMMNGWLLYQTISCRLWSRSAFYQAGGAFGFRDQLQDCLSAAVVWPEIAEKQILKHAAHQFIEGDVLHWWHEPAGKGTRTRISDDYLWLPYVTAEYIRITGDFEVLNRQIPFLEGDILKGYENERYFQPGITKETASLYAHCIRAVENALKFGERGLPLIGGGDWNDGMNTVGNGGKGESVWLGWFLYSTLQKFIPICRCMKDDTRAEKYEILGNTVTDAIEKNCWDGNWYVRAFFDDGEPLGSVRKKECKIDSLTQSWAVISGKGDIERAVIAMNSIEDYLVMHEEGLIKLLTPPFNDGDSEPGYIKGYVPGVRENGGQYTHAAAWVIMAFAMLGNGDKAGELFRLVNPINHTRTDRECSIYKTEPYAVPADVYAVHPHTGRGGWTWYTGSANWIYKAGLENILGFRKYADKLIIDPCIPKKWKEYILKYNYIKTTYNIKVINPDMVCRGVASITVDGKVLNGNEIELKNDKKRHDVEVLMGTPLNYI